MKPQSVAACVLAASLLCVAPAFAQEPAPRLAVTLGYGTLWASPNPCTDCDWSWYQVGFNVDAAVPLAEPWQFIGEFGWSRHPYRADPLRQAGGLNAISAAGGLRWSRNRASLAPFAQIVGGLHRDTVHGGTGVGLPGFNEEGFPKNSFMVQPGAGVVIPINQGFGVVAQVDYRRVFSDDGMNGVRIVAGIRLNSN